MNADNGEVRRPQAAASPASQRRGMPCSSIVHTVHYGTAARAMVPFRALERHCALLLLRCYAAQCANQICVCGTSGSSRGRHRAGGPAGRLALSPISPHRSLPFLTAILHFPSYPSWTSLPSISVLSHPSLLPLPSSRCIPRLRVSPSARERRVQPKYRTPGPAHAASAYSQQ